MKESHIRMRQAIENAAWLIGEKLIRMLLGLLVSASVARYLGPAQFGELAYGVSLCAFFLAFATLGLDGLVVRDIATKPEMANEILGTVFRLRLGAAFSGWLCACILAWVLRPGDSHTLLIVALIGAAILFQPADTIDLWFQSKTQSRRTVSAKIVGYLIACGLKVILIVAAAPLYAFAAVNIADTAIVAVLLFFSYSRFPSGGNGWSWNFPLARRLIGESWPVMIAGLSIIVYMRIDQLMLRALADEAELGIFSAAVPLSQAWTFLPVAICSTALPYMSRLRREDPAAFQAKLQLLFTFLVWLAISIVVVTLFLAPKIVSLILGVQYQGAALVLMIHITTNIFIFLGVAQSQWIIVEGRTRLTLIKSGVGAIVSVAANFILIPQYGAVGAAISAVIAQAMSSVLCNIVIAPAMFKMQIEAIMPFRLIFRFRRSVRV